MGEHKSRFLVKQRAFLKIYLIHMAENEMLYGLEFLEVIKEEFRKFGYRPNHSEIYKSLHELEDQCILKRMKRIKQGKKYQEVVFYVIDNKEEANLYKKQLKVEMDRCYNLIGKAISDIYG